MILKVKYNEVMEHVELSAEAKERILANLSQAESNGTSGVSGSRETNARHFSFRSWQSYAAVAACFVVILAGVLTLRPVLNQQEPDPAITIVNPVTAYETAAALSDSLGFPVEDAGTLPITIDSIRYESLNGEIAQTVIESGERIIRFRKSAGSEDNSGDYNTYSSEKETDLDGVSITLKGDGQTCNLALWEKDGYVNSLSAEEAGTGIPEEDMLAMVEALLHP